MKDERFQAEIAHIKLLLHTVLLHSTSITPSINAVVRLSSDQDLVPATQELQEIFAIRRILLKHGRRNDVRLSAL